MMARLLIVDDDPVVLSFVGHLLEPLGEPVLASGGEDALRRIAASPPDIVLLDAMMPGMDGFELCRTIKSDPAHEDLPVLFITAQHDHESENRAFALGAADFLTKPINPQALLARVRTQLALRERTRALRARNETLRQMFETSRVVKLIVAPEDGRIEDANQAACDFYGYPRERLLALRIGDIELAPADPAEAQAPGRDHESARHRLACGGIRDVEVRSGPVDTERGVRLYSIIHDVTERNRQAAEIARLALIVQKSDNAVIITDGRMRIEWVNEAFTRMTGYRPDEAIGRSPAELLHGPKTDRQATGAVRTALLQGRKVAATLLNHAKDGRPYWVELEIFPVTGPAGTIDCYIAIERDVTARKTNEAALEQALDDARRANRAKADFLANMSHEIRTPLNAVLGLTHVLQERGPTPAQRRRLDMIAAAGRHLLGVINEILELSKIDAEKFELNHAEFSPGDVAGDVLAMVAAGAREKGLRLVQDTDGLPAGLWGDAQRLAQALLNYAGNAVKFTERGRIRLSGRLVEEGADDVLLRFEVEDTGPGFHPADAERLFESFEQGDRSIARRHGGTGLGLAITRRIARRMGGDAGAVGRPGEGSVFWFTARLARRGTAESAGQPLAGRAGPADAPPADFGGARVLLAEDDPINRQVACDLLAAVSIVPVIAENGLQAVEAARGARFDLILMDMRMPDMDGLSASRRIRMLPGHASTPIVAMTANAYAGDVVACRAAGMNGHLAKPVDPPLLYRTLSEWLRPAPPASPPAATAPPAADAGDGPDLSRIAGLDSEAALRNLRGRRDAYVRLLARFAEMHAAPLRTLPERLEDGDAEALARLAHQIKGSAGVLGIVRVRDAAVALEDRARGPHSAEELAAAAVALQAAFAEHCRAWQDALAAAPVPTDSGDGNPSG